MAKPRVFISSTFYDLKQIREDLERFVRELGYEPVRNETGGIPYGKDEPAEAYAYREVELCDIIVSIIGGRFGTESQQEQGLSISQAELRRALDNGIQVFIFIENSVNAEYSTYQVNKTNKTVAYNFVDDVRVYEFIESLRGLPHNNPIATFETSTDIIGYLRAQWGGLFQRFLQEQKLLSQTLVLDEMKSVASTLQQLVNFLTEERKNKDDAIGSILMANHPAFRRFAKITGTTYRVFFSSKNELDAWLSARGWLTLPKDQWEQGAVEEWADEKLQQYIKMTEKIFDDRGRLRIYSESDWSDEWVTRGRLESTGEEEIPF